LDAGQFDIMIDRHNRPIADFRDLGRPPLSKKLKKNAYENM